MVESEGLTRVIEIAKDAGPILLWAGVLFALGFALVLGLRYMRNVKMWSCLILAFFILGAGIIAIVDADHQSVYHLPRWADALLMFVSGILTLSLAYRFRETKAAFV